LSLRQLAEKVKVTAPFISDVELGRRYPSEGVLAAIASVLGVDVEELKNLDTRDSVPLVKRLVEADPRWGVAFRIVAEEGRAGRLTPDQVIQRFRPSQKQRKPCSAETEQGRSLFLGIDSRQ
jgi:transcriptional regulator with XRE-family HTH domain